ncbi:MAG: ketopantoate reductase family protein [Lachnospiraceae bacterium]|nr:ketopantoate reductase family protein [Lachnospiraceae bacterium]
MKYLVVGAGGTGGCIAAYLAMAGYPTTLIARGAHLAGMREHGFVVKGTRWGDVCLGEDKLKTMTAEEYLASGEKADVVFICVKSYSIDEITPFVEKATTGDSLIIPILNVVNTGKRMQKMLPERQVLSGCIYIASVISGPGEVSQLTKSMKIVYGDRENRVNPALMDAVCSEMIAAKIDTEVAEDIGPAAFEKFIFLSPYAASGAYLDVISGEFQKEGPAKDFFVSMLKEVVDVAHALGYDYNGRDMVKEKTDHLQVLNPLSTASMVKDVKKGGRSEMDGLVFEVVRLGHKLGVPVPVYEKVSAHYGFVDENVSE